MMVPAKAQVCVLWGPLRGMRWIAGSSSNGCWIGTSEAEKLRGFANTIKLGQVVYDLGANVGYYTLLASILVGTKGRVISFEPNPRNLAYLQKHLELNKVTNCTIWEAAVGSAEGTSYFEGPSRFEGHLIDASEGALAVKVVTLDCLVTAAKLPPPDVIKCDIEGGEYDALLGAANTLDKYGPTIFLATHGREVHQKCCNFLTNFGYHLTSINSSSIDETSELLATRQ